MAASKDHGGGREDNPYCRVCTDRSGTLLGFEEVVESMAKERFEKVQRMPPEAARQAARRALERMPKWRSRAE